MGSIMENENEINFYKNISRKEILQRLKKKSVRSKPY